MVYSVFLWRKGFQRDDWVVYGVLAGGLVLHTVAMAARGFSLNACPINNLYEATAFIMWTIVAGYLVVGAVSVHRRVCLAAAFHVGSVCAVPGHGSGFAEGQT